MKLAASAKLFKTLDEIGLVNYVFEPGESFYLFDTDTGECGLRPYFNLEECDNAVNVFTDYRYCLVPLKEFSNPVAVYKEKFSVGLLQFKSMCLVLRVMKSSFYINDKFMFSKWDTASLREVKLSIVACGISDDENKMVLVLHADNGSTTGIDIGIVLDNERKTIRIGQDVLPYKSVVSVMLLGEY